MDKLREEYVDGIAQIHFINGMVRMDLARAEPKEGQEKPDQVSFERLIFNPQGFLNALGAMQQLVDKLVEAGVLQRRENAPNVQQ